MSSDSGFYELAATIGPPPKIVWLRRWTHPTRDAEAILRREAVRSRASRFWTANDGLTVPVVPGARSQADLAGLSASH